MRGLSDQMEPAPPQVQELRAALAIWRRSAEEWRERAQTADAEVARLRAALEPFAELSPESCEILPAFADIHPPVRVGDILNARAVLAKGGGDGG